MKKMIIGCSGKKKPGFMACWEKYDGPLWQSLRAVEGYKKLIIEGRILVISAKHGLVPASLIIDDYNQTLSSIQDIQTLGVKVLGQLPDLISRDDEIIVVAGEKYRNALSLAYTGYEFVAGGIGEKRKRMKIHLKEMLEE